MMNNQYEATYGSYGWGKPVRPTGRWRLVWKGEWTEEEPTMYVEHKKGWWRTIWLHEDCIYFKPIPVTIMFSCKE